MLVIFICLTIITISWIQISDLIKNKHWRELVVVLFFLLPGFVVSILLAAGIPVPNPVKGIEFVVNQVLSLSKMT